MELTLVSCNIRFDNPADGPNSWPHRRLFLRDILLSHSPDIIATQEGRFHQLQDLNSLLPEYEVVDDHRAWIGERMYPTFFVKKNRFEKMKSEDIWLSETPDIAGSRSFDSAFPRLMTWMKIQPVNSQNDLWLVNTHLDHIKDETRLGQIQVLSRELKRFWNKQDSLIIMGDFNEGPDGKVRQHLVKEFDLQDTWKLFHQKEESSHHAFQGEVPNGNRIDWILVDKKVKVLKSEMDKSSREGKFPTDHYPVMAKISF
ncbi:MAG: endonuclease/exonuclease/phosphatase family protein [Bdellovibrionota bacterium]